MSVLISTDGSIDINPGGTGGYGAVLTFPELNAIEFVYGREENTTNNRMEMQALIWALKYLKDIEYHGGVKVFSDSEYVVLGANYWLEGWIKKEKLDEKKNTDLWIEILNLCNEFEPEIIWVKGHNGNTWNEYADELAELAAKADEYAIKELKSRVIGERSSNYREV